MARRIGTRARAVGLRAWMMACGAAIGIACSSAEQGGGDASCVPGMQVTCGCPGGDEGVQVCGFDGFAYEPCQCGDFDEGEDSGTSSGGDESTTGDACGNGFADPGE